MSGTIDANAVNAFVNDCYPELGSRCVDIGQDFAVAEYDLNGITRRPGGYISGPDQFRLADAVFWFLTFGVIGRMEQMNVTSELSIRYVRPALGEQLFARARLEARTRRSVVGSVWLWCDRDEARKVSVCQGTYSLPPESSGESVS
jgi:acyl-coenzyme A thioesterase PaaI-like protein